MPRPIETLLSLPRVRLIDRVPILETESYVRRFLNSTEFRGKLVEPALQVSEGSARQFLADDQGLSTLLEEIDSAEYVVNAHSKRVMEEMLKAICADGSIFKRFEEDINSLCNISQALRKASKLADALADRAKEDSLDVARALLIDLPTEAGQPRLRGE